MTLLILGKLQSEELSECGSGCGPACDSWAYTTSLSSLRFPSLPFRKVLSSNCGSSMEMGALE